tara:strand:+ start:70 stop:486 length:417 start_codon:yes stop_codon:yes gene_type:complete
MIKYEINRFIQIESGPHREVKFISKSELKKFEDEDWFFVRKKYFIITNFLDWWNSFTTVNKIGITAIFIPILFGGIYFCLDKYSENKYEDLYKSHENLKLNYKNLKVENNSLKKRNLILYDSINKLNERTESKQKLPK